MSSATLAPGTRRFPHIPEALWPFVSDSKTWPTEQRLALIKPPANKKTSPLPRKRSKGNGVPHRDPRRAHCRH